MEEYLANKKITKVYRGKSGEGQYGPWQAWNLYIDGDDRKFAYFSGGKKPEPFEGAFIQMMKFETVTKGKYTNHNVKEMALGQPENNEPRQDPPHDYEPPGEAQKPNVTPPVTHRGDEKASFYVSYAKDLMCSLIEKGEYPEGVTLKECAKQVMDVGLWMQKTANGEEVPF